MMLRRAAVVFVLLSGSAGVRAHSFHSAVAEAELNRATGRLEIALRVCPDDLHRALRTFYRDRAEVSKVACLDDLIRQYLHETFVVRSASGVRRDLIWVGKEMDAEEVWLYFEVPLPDGLGGARICFDVLLGEFADQLNTLDLRDGRRRRVISFSRERRERSLGSRRRAEPSAEGVVRVPSAAREERHARFRATGR